MSNTNTLGLFFEFRDDSGTLMQVIALPGDNVERCHIWWRERSEARTRWSRINLHTLDGLTDATLEKNPVTFVVSEKTAREICTTGWSYSMPTTALRSHERSENIPSNGDTSLPKFLLECLQKKLAPNLNAHLKNDKRVNEVPVVSIESLAGTVAAGSVVATPMQPVQAPVSVSQPEPVSEQDEVFKAVLYPPSYADAYVSRKVHGVEDFDIFDAALSRGQNVLLGGDTGAGKTIAVKAWAARRGLRVAQVTGNPQNDAYRIMGKQILDNGNSRFQPGLLHELFRHGGVLLLDEVDLNTDGFLSELFPTLRERVLTLHDSEGETLFAHPDFIVIATMNGTRGYRRRELDAAMKNRFTHIIDWRYDPEVERRLGVVGAVADLAAGIRVQFYQEEITTPVPTNALIDFQNIARDISLDYAIGNFVARFARDEQSAILLTLSGIRANLKNDLGL